MYTNSDTYAINDFFAIGTIPYLYKTVSTKQIV